MRKYIALFLLVALAVVAFAARTHWERIGDFTYENGTVNFRHGGTAFSSAVGDTVTGVAAAAASLDTVYIGVQKNGVSPEHILVMVQTTEVNNQDKVYYRLRAVIGGVIGSQDLQVDSTAATAGINQVIEYDLDGGDEIGDQLAIIVDGTAGADTDSTAYAFWIEGRYPDN